MENSLSISFQVMQVISRLSGVLYNPLFALLILLPSTFRAQEKKEIKFPENLINTCIANLKNNDSLLYYQCHVDEAKTEITTSSGEKITGETKKISITDKYIVYNNNGTYTLKHYSSTFNALPNRKFTYLKVREKDYWNFKLEKDTVLNEHDVQIFAAIEKKSHNTTEYDFVIDKYNTNAIIIRNKKTMKHLVVEGNHLIKKNLEVLR